MWSTVKTSFSPFRDVVRSVLNARTSKTKVLYFWILILVDGAKRWKMNWLGEWRRRRGGLMTFKLVFQRPQIADPRPRPVHLSPQMLVATLSHLRAVWQCTWLTVVFINGGGHLADPNRLRVRSKTNFVYTIREQITKTYFYRTH